MSSQYFVFFCACALSSTAIVGNPALHLIKFVNESTVGYQVVCAGQDLTFILPPKKPGARPMIKEFVHLSNIIDLFQDSPVILVPLKGDGLPIYVGVGPESSGEGLSGMPVSVIYWCGPESADSDEKTYQTYELSENSSVGLTIHDGGLPEVVPLEDIKKIDQF